MVVVYLVEWHHVARENVLPWRWPRRELIGFPGCYPNAYADRVMKRLCTHPNVGAVLLVSLGCESFRRQELAETGAPVGPAGSYASDPGDRRHAVDDGRGARVGGTGPGAVERHATGGTGNQRSGGRDDLWRFGTPVA